MDSTDDWRSLLNYKYSEPEYQALFVNNSIHTQPAPPHFSSSGSLKRPSVDGGSIRSNSYVEEIVDGKKSYESYSATKFPAKPEIPDPLDEQRYLIDLDDLLSRVEVTSLDNEIVASIQFLQAVFGSLVSKAAELRRSVIEHVAYVRLLTQPLRPEDIEYLDSTIFLNYASMREELREIANELALLKPWKVRRLFSEDLDEDTLIEAAGGLSNHSTIIHLLAESYGVGHKFMELERVIVSVGQELQDEITRSLITVSQLHDYTAAMIKYPNGIKEVVTWEEFDEMYEKIAGRRSALSRDFERFMRSRNLTVTNPLFAYLQHPEKYAHMLMFHQYRFAKGEFVGMIDWLENQDEEALQACRPFAPAWSASRSHVPFAESKTNQSDHTHPAESGAVALDPPESILRQVRVISMQHCELTDRDAHKLAHALPRLTRLAALNLSHNKLSYSALASFATVVFQHPMCVQSLQMLYLDDNRIASDGLQVLAQILHPHCARLVKLSLNDNPIGDTGVYQLLQTMLNPQRRAHAYYAALQPKNQARLRRQRQRRQRRLRNQRRRAEGATHANKEKGEREEEDDDRREYEDEEEYEEEEEEEEEEVMMTLDMPQHKSLNRAHSAAAAKSVNQAHSVHNNLIAANTSDGGHTNNASGDVQLALQSQRRYPLHCFLSDYFAPSLVLETQRSLLAAAEYDVQHGGDGSASLRQHHYLFQRRSRSSSPPNKDRDASDEFENDGGASLPTTQAINYDWINDIDVEEFTMDVITSDYSSEDSETEDRRLITTAVARVQKLRGVVASAAANAPPSMSGPDDAPSPQASAALAQNAALEARYRSIPRRTLERIQARIHRSRERKRRRERLTFRERLVLREKRALGVHKTRKMLREQHLLRAMADDVEADEDLLEESSDDGDDDYHESDEEEGADESGFDGGFYGDSKGDGERESGNDGDGSEDDDDGGDGDVDVSDDDTHVLPYTAPEGRTSKRVSIASIKAHKSHGNQKHSKKRSSVMSHASLSEAMMQSMLNKTKRFLLSTTSLLQRAKVTKVFSKYPKLVQRILNVRLKLVAVTMFLGLRRRSQLPYLGCLSLARCQLTSNVLPALAMTLRENNCLLSLDISGNGDILVKQEDCALFASAMRYSLDMKSGEYRRPSPQQLRTMQLLQHTSGNPSSSLSKLPSQEVQFYATSLQHLALNDVGMTDAGLVALATAWSMPSCPLVRIELEGNRFGPTAVNVLANLCQRAHYYLGSAALVKQSKSAISTTGANSAAAAKKVKPPVFSLEDDDFHRDEGFLADESLLQSQENATLSPRKTKQHQKELALELEREEAEKRRLRRQHRESLALGKSTAADWSKPVRLVDEDEDSLDSFQDKDMWSNAEDDEYDEDHDQDVHPEEDYYDDEEE